MKQPTAPIYPIYPALSIKTARRNKIIDYKIFQR